MEEGEDGGAEGLEPELEDALGLTGVGGGVEPCGVRQLEGGLGAEGEDVEDGLADGDATDDAQAVYL